MKLTTRQLEILDFCEEPKLASEIAEYLGLAVNSIYKYMNALTRNGYLKTINAQSKKHNAIKMFITDLDLESEFRTIIFQEVNTFNMDFLKVAHNPFNIGARNG